MKKTGKRDSFIVYRSFYDASKSLSDQEQLNYLRALMEYGLDHTEPSLEGSTKALFELSKPQLDANFKRYQNGSKRKAKPKQNVSKTEANVNVNDNVNDNVNVNVNDNVLASTSLNPFSLIDEEKKEKLYSRRKQA